MTVVSFRKKVVRRRRRRFVPRKRVFTAKSLYPRRTIYIHKGRFRLFKHRDPMPRMFRRFNMYVLPTGKGKSYSQKYTPKPEVVISAFDLAKVKKNWQSKWNAKKKTWAMEARPVQKPSDVQFERQFIRERKKSFKEELKPSKPIKKRYNKGWFRKGEAPPQRTYTNYGKMRRLGPDPVIVIKPTVELAKAIKKEQKKLSKGWMSGAIKNSLDTLLGNIIKHAEMIIELYVPKDTGDLRASMMKELERRKRMGYRLEVRVGTPVMGRNLMTYANPVNHMPESMIQHDANKRSAKTRKMLFDPKAQKGWYEIIRMKLNNHLTKTLIPAFYRNLARDSIQKWGIGFIPKAKMPTTYKLEFDLVTAVYKKGRINSNIRGVNKALSYDEDFVKTTKYQRELRMKSVEVPINRSRMTDEEYGKMLKEKVRSKPERFSKWRQDIEQTKRFNKGKLNTSYKISDVMKWFKIEIPFKR